MVVLCVDCKQRTSKQTGKEFFVSQVLCWETYHYELADVFADMQPGMIYDIDITLKGRVLSVQAMQQLDLGDFYAIVGPEVLK